MLMLLLLLHCGLHSCLLFLRLFLEVLNELLDSHAGLLCVSGELLLHRHDLFAGGHLPRLRRSLHGEIWVALRLQSLEMANRFYFIFVS